MDLAVLEEKLSDPQTSLMVLCNPHNPVGRIWERDTLYEVADLCKKNGVILVSDELHCDITKPGTHYVPLMSVSDAARENSVILMSPTKTFNLAGLQTSAVYAENEFLFNRVRRGLNTDEVAEPNTFAAGAAMAAFDKGEEWLDELNRYLWENRALAESEIKEKMTQISLVKNEATYLLWLDVSGVLKDEDTSSELSAFIREKTGLWLSSGNVYGGNGASFLRMNIATCRERVADGLTRLAAGIKAYGL